MGADVKTAGVGVVIKGAVGMGVELANGATGVSDEGGEFNATGSAGGAGLGVAGFNGGKFDGE